MAAEVRASKVPGGFLRRHLVAPGVRAVTGLPLALAAVPLVLGGQGDHAARWQVRVADRFGSRQPAAQAVVVAYEAGLVQRGDPG